MVMKCTVAIATVAAACVIGGCAPRVGAPPIATVRDDSFLPYREIATSSFETKLGGGDRARGHLAARRDKTTGTVTTYAVLGVVYAQRTSRRYDSARNNRAEALPLRQLFHDGAGCRRKTDCAHAELYQVDIPEADLRRALGEGEGYAIKLFGRIGHATLFPIPKELVAGLISEIDATRSRPGAAHPPPDR